MVFRGFGDLGLLVVCLLIGFAVCWCFNFTFVGGLFVFRFSVGVVNLVDV